MKKIIFSTSLFLISLLSLNSKAALPNPIIFVTQVPMAGGHNAIGDPFANHLGDIQNVRRGGDLYILYPDGTLKNLTQLCGFGSTGANGFQDQNSIAVREPSVSWDGTKALFSMVKGAPTSLHDNTHYYWQIYEVTNLGQNQSPSIRKINNQPLNYNNVSPIYGTNGRIIFATDMPRGGAPYLYPQYDEYHGQPTNTGLWSLDEISGDLIQLDHSPSGDFSPFIDSYGRVIFSRWDHLRRDGNVDDEFAHPGVNKIYPFNFADETQNALRTQIDYTPGNPGIESFPEPQGNRTDLLPGNLNGQEFNIFFPWNMNENGTSMETINHIGRHEMSPFFTKNFTDDPNLLSINRFGTGGTFVSNTLQPREDPSSQGTYFAIDAATSLNYHGAGYIFKMSNAGLGAGGTPLNADNTTLSFVTRTTFTFGRYKNVLPLVNGTLVAAHSDTTSIEAEIGTVSATRDTIYSKCKYSFRLKTLIAETAPYYRANTLLTSSIPTKNIKFYNPDTLVVMNAVRLWELDPCEVVSRTVPTTNPINPGSLPAQETTAITNAGLTVTQVKNYLTQNNLSLIVSRNVTTRDGHDKQQPFNLRVVDTNGTYQNNYAQTIGASGKVYDISHLQIFQADQVRGYMGPNNDINNPLPGRRPIPLPLHDPSAKNPNINPNEPKGSVRIFSDGSLAAFVPSRRALSWQMTDTSKTAIVRERFWLTFQPGEIVTCNSCHGLNTGDQLNHPKPTNVPAALTSLLNTIKPSIVFANQVSLKVIFSIQGLWNGTNLSSDTVRVYLRSSSAPYNKIDSVVKVVNSQGNDSVSFANAPAGTYYVSIKHRNSLETWSAATQSLPIGSYSVIDLTTGQNSAYGNNLIFSNGQWCMYSGDIDGDGIINGNDFTVFSSQFAQTGYLNSDLNNDGIVNGNDFTVFSTGFGHQSLHP
ncbi:MAG: hypothetical protein JSS63_00660 [Bacteroidetes bacterium]|nr:hypothetical protein [Bacteroidota bacterium]